MVTLFAVRDKTTTKKIMLKFFFWKKYRWRFCFGHGRFLVNGLRIIVFFFELVVKIERLVDLFHLVQPVGTRTSDLLVNEPTLLAIALSLAGGWVIIALFWVCGSKFFIRSYIYMSVEAPPIRHTPFWLMSQPPMYGYCNITTSLDKYDIW